MAQTSGAPDSHLLHLIHRILLAELAGLDHATLWQHAEEEAAQDLGWQPAKLRKFAGNERKRLASGVDPDLTGAWPSPIAFNLALLAGVPALASATAVEEDPFKRLCRLVGAFEVCLKYVAVVVLSDVLQDQAAPLALRNILASTLHRPYLGHWVSYARLAAGEPGGRADSPFVPEIVRYVDRYIDAPPTNHLLKLRNLVAHGTVPIDEETVRLLHSHTPDLLALLYAGAFLRKYPLVVVGRHGAILAAGCDPKPVEVPVPAEPGGVLLGSPERDRWLPLTPLTWMGAGDADVREAALEVCQGFLVYSDLDRKKKAVNLLNYATGLHVHDRDLYGDFSARFPLTVWSKQGQDEAGTQTRIEHLSDGYIERLHEAREIECWISECSAGFFVLHGKPGIGKSSLVARVARRDMPYMETGERDDRVAQAARVAVMPFFYGHSTSGRDARSCLKGLLQQFSRRFDLRCGLAADVDVDALAKELAGQLRALSQRLQSGGGEAEKVVLLMDGLDEAVAEGGTENLVTLLRALPRTLPPGILMLISSRYRDEVDKFFKDLDERQRRLYEVPPLNADTTRAMLYSVLSMYDLADQPDYVEAVVRCSEGLPLYLTMLATDIQERRIRPFQVDALPKGVKDYFEKTIDYLQRTSGHRQKTLEVLLTLAVAVEPLTAARIARLVEVDLVIAMELLEHNAEVLRVEPAPGGETTYSVFHTSFGEYLREHGDYQDCLRTDIEPRFLLEPWLEKKEEEPPDVADQVARLLGSDPLGTPDVATIGAVLDRLAGRVTAFELAARALDRRLIPDLGDFLFGLAGTAGGGSEHTVVRRLVVGLHEDPEGVLDLVDQLAPERPLPGPADDPLRPLRVALEVAAAALRADVEPVRGRALDVVRRACCSNDPSAATLGTMALFRIATIDVSVALNVVGQLADRVLWWRVVRLHAVESFACAALGLFFEKAANPEVTSRLHEMTRRVLSRAFGLRLAVRILPPLVERFLGNISSDYNALNLMEINAAKTLLRDNAELREINTRLIDLIDPAAGGPDDLAEVVDRLIANPVEARHGFCLFPLGSSTISQTLAHGEAALEAAWRYCEANRGRGVYFSQSLLADIRFVQVGFKMLNQPPLGDVWSERIEETLRSFYHDCACTFHINRPYYGGYMASGLLFLAAQGAGAHLQVLRDLVQDACSRSDETATPRQHHRDAILLRMLEVVGIEYGTFEPLGLEIAFFGLRCFLDHASSTDKDRRWDWRWRSIAELLVRLRTYFPEQVAGFLEALDSPPVRARLQSDMRSVRTEETVGTLLGMKIEYFNVAAYAEPVDRQDGLRAYWQEYQRILYSPTSLRGTLTSLVTMILDLLGRDNGDA